MKELNSAINYFKTNSNEVKSILKDFNLKKITSNFSKNNILNLVLKDFVDLNFKAPKGFKLNKKSQNFWWWSKLEIRNIGALLRTSFIRNFSFYTYYHCGCCFLL